MQYQLKNSICTSSLRVQSALEPAPRMQAASCNIWLVWEIGQYGTVLAWPNTLLTASRIQAYCYFPIASDPLATSTGIHLSTNRTSSTKPH